jgi:hypothetical protein
MADQLSKAKKLAGDTWSGLTTAVSTQWQIRGLQKQIAEVVGQRDRLMMDIGHKVYALYGRGKVKNADLLELCRQIEEASRNVDSLNQRIRDLSEPRPEGGLEEADLEDDTPLEEAEEPAAEEPATEAPTAPEAASAEPAAPGEGTPAGES